MMIPKTYLVVLFTILLCFSSCFLSTEARKLKSSAHSKPKNRYILNVESFGAKDDEKTDSFQAFKKAWDKACSSLKPYTILVPKGKTYFVKHINFTGPCRSGISMEIQGTIKAFPQMYDTPRRLWIKFENVRNIEVFGGGTIDGNGDVWWSFSCKIKKSKPCQSQNAPTALTFQNCTNLKVSNLNLVNAQQMQLNIQDSHDVELSKLKMTAPEQSPNTDGIHITRSTNLDIFDSLIQTGDDCISIVNGSRNIQVRNIECGPGHGISIGSLGEDKYENHVSDIHVKGVKLTGTTNGVRIKTWQGGKGSARNIVFEDIYMKNVSNPIIINQFYCDKNKRCEKQIDAVAIENIVYKNITGTSASNVAVTFNCSESVPCRNVVLENVNLKPQGNYLKKVEAICSQVKFQIAKKNFFPLCPKQK